MDTAAVGLPAQPVLANCGSCYNFATYFCACAIRLRSGVTDKQDCKGYDTAIGLAFPRAPSKYQVTTLTQCHGIKSQKTLTPNAHIHSLHANQQTSSQDDVTFHLPGRFPHQYIIHIAYPEFTGVCKRKYMKMQCCTCKALHILTHCAWERLFTFSLN